MIHQVGEQTRDYGRDAGRQSNGLWHDGGTLAKLCREVPWPLLRSGATGLLIATVLAAGRGSSVAFSSTALESCAAAMVLLVLEVLSWSWRALAAPVRAPMVEDVRYAAVPGAGRQASRTAAPPKQICVERLLGRSPVQMHSRLLIPWLRGRTVLITGGAGSIGSELVRQVLAFEPAKVIVVDRSEHGVFEVTMEHEGCERIVCCLADANDERRMAELLGAHRPDIIFHAAAFKHVPILETHPREAIQNIIGSTVRLAKLASRFGVRSFVLISTDKAVAPASVMGACKRIAERYLQSMAMSTPCRMVIVRFGNVLDSAGSVVPIFRKQIASGGPITVTHPEVERYFMTIPEASQLVMHAAAMGAGGEVFVLKMGDPVKIVDLARDMIRLSGLEPDRDIAIEFTGLRPGEKLRERLADTNEQLEQTSHPDINVVQAREHVPARYADAVEDLIRHARETSAGLIDRIGALVPEYAPPLADRATHAAPAASDLRIGSPSSLISGVSAT